MLRTLKILLLSIAPLGGFAGKIRNRFRFLIMRQEHILQ